MVQHDHETLVFVYGSLLQGLSNHRRLAVPGVRFVGVATTIDKYFMAGLGFPILNSRRPEYFIKGEVYAVPPAVLESLDQLESHPDAYVRTPISVRVGEPSMDGDSHQQAAGAGATPTVTGTIVTASVYFGDIFWELEGESAFDALTVPEGDFRAFWYGLSAETGWVPGTAPPHPLPIDEPIVAVQDGDAAVMQWIRSRTNCRLLGYCRRCCNDDGTGRDSLFFVPPVLLSQLDKLMGHRPATGGGHAVVVRRPVQVLVTTGPQPDTGPNGMADGQHGASSRGAAPPDWIPGGHPVAGDRLWAFVYKRAEQHSGPTLTDDDARQRIAAAVAVVSVEVAQAAQVVGQMPVEPVASAAASIAAVPVQVLQIPA